MFLFNKSSPADLSPSFQTLTKCVKLEMQIASHCCASSLLRTHTSLTPPSHYYLFKPVY